MICVYEHQDQQMFGLKLTNNIMSSFHPLEVIQIMCVRVEIRI